MTVEHFSFFVIGGGSGGIASARRAATYGARVAVAEGLRWGGTCVNVGCVPKKMMWCCANMMEALHDAKHYGFTMNGTPSFSWEYMKSRRDATILRLNGIYEKNLDSSGVVHFKQFAKFNGVDSNGVYRIKVGDSEVTADHVLIAAGGRPSPLDAPGAEHCINSDKFFELESLPKKVAVVGAGYIAVELAGVFTTLGSETHLFTRGKTALRKFDSMLSSQLHQEMQKQGCIMHPESGGIASVTKEEGTAGLLTITTKSGEKVDGFNHVLVAIGREPMTDSFALETIGGLKSTAAGHVVVDEFQATSMKNVFALGDVCGQIELTPMAIAAGRRLADRLFGGKPDSKADYTLVPTVIFSHPPIGTIGLTEDEAVTRFGKENVKVYNSTSVNLYYSAFDCPPQEKPKVIMKLVCHIPDEERILGMHIIGMGADEMLQGFGVAIKMGARKRDLDNCVAIHPTAAEEMVTLPPWGL